MSYNHADPEPIAEAEILRPDAEEDDEVLGPGNHTGELCGLGRDCLPVVGHLRLDTDGVFRWYEEDEASEVSGATLHGALQQAESLWDGFQLVEYGGEPVTPGGILDDVYAADALEDLEDDG